MSARTTGPDRQESRVLTEREQAVLRSVVRTFVQTADPVGSRVIARRHMPGLSAASIRNTMSDLEELGYLDHPYTSAGRVPTELGYRTFVDELMDQWRMPPAQRRVVRAQIAAGLHDPDELLRRCARLLGSLSDLLGVALSPELSNGVLDRLEVVPLSSTRAMFVISVRSGLVKTIVLEVDSDLNRRELDTVVAVLNERLAGLTLDEIRKTFASRVKDLPHDSSGIIKLVLRKAPAIFSDLHETRRCSYGGAQNIVVQPEFREPAEVRNVMELLEHEEMVVQLLEGVEVPDSPDLGKARVTIGRENTQANVEKYSVVSAKYRIGDTTGTIGVIGPMRMDYSRVISVVEHMARLLSQSSDGNSN